MQPTEQKKEENQESIDWDSFWAEYVEQHKYAPRRVVHLWNFAKIEKERSVTYKEARSAFERIQSDLKTKAMKATKGTNRSEEEEEEEGREDEGEGEREGEGNSEGEGEGDRNHSNHKVDEWTLALNNNDTTEHNVRGRFLEILKLFRVQMKNDPKDAWMLFKFIRSETEYSVRYGDVKSCYAMAVEQKWFKPMKRMKKKKKTKTKETKKETTLSVEPGNDTDYVYSNSCDRTDPDVGEEEGCNVDDEEETEEFVLAVDTEKVNKEKEKTEFAAKVLRDKKKTSLTSDEFEEIMEKYAEKYKHPPRDVKQVMTFVHEELHRFYKYGVLRTAMLRYQIR